MPQRRSVALTILFSLLPGAGHMFIGLMKIGLSLMVAFFGLIFVSSWLHIGALMYIIPILVFYSFFDCINKCCASNEEFALIEDHYLFSLNKITDLDRMFHGRGKLVAGIAFFLIGLYLLWESLMSTPLLNLSGEYRLLLDSITDLLPRFVIGILIIILGIYLIIGKKRNGDENA